MIQIHHFFRSYRIHWWAPCPRPLVFQTLHLLDPPPPHFWTHRMDVLMHTWRRIDLYWVDRAVGFMGRECKGWMG